MEISNQKRSKYIKRFFILTGLITIAISQLLLWYKNELAVIITAIFFALYVVVFLFANFCHVFLSTEDGKVLIKYYPVISFIKRNYKTIEFTHQSLLNFQIEKGLGFSDLTIAIRTKRGIAEYPPISLAAMSKAEIEQIGSALSEIMRNNR
jgi:hypothetical protein